jgi:hypothetical protein
LLLFLLLLIVLCWLLLLHRHQLCPLLHQLEG